ncbi:Glutathione S-transferase 1 [Apostichopus japonicus]|uniref:glutathione transferase n=1 Tax=Stichopus japonicus TaxID=307972 RepID=A0A2G8L7W0_STIJA|nr:Glutathione S-transferase 1 [Apostichopus japonicus]
MPTYKLTYFNAKARAETARFIFAVAGQEYEDNRLKREEWPELKKTMPFGQVPLLEIDGKPLAHSGAINRTLARRFKLYGDNESEAAEIDQVCECLVDLGLAMRNYFHEKDVARKENILKELLETEASKHFKFLLNLLEANYGGNGFYVGNRLSLADLDAATYLTDMVARVPGLKVTEPKLLAHVNRILETPALSQWLKKRPQTPF